MLLPGNRSARPSRPGEIDEGRHFTLDEVRGMIGTGALTPMFEREWPMLLAR